MFHTARLATEKADFRPALPLCSMPGLIGQTMTTMSYSEQLRHPNWQRKRLETLEAAEFRCEGCMDAERTLHVHHKRYFKGRMAWEYDRAELAVLCEVCHEEEHTREDWRKRLFSRLDVDGPLSIDDFIGYGAGAMADWIAEPELFSMLEQVKHNKPLQFWSGRLARDLDSFGLRAPGLEKVASELITNPAFVSEIRAVLEKYGVPLSDY